jgi:hypothetical protein
MAMACFEIDKKNAKTRKKRRVFLSVLAFSPMTNVIKTATFFLIAKKRLTTCCKLIKLS